MKTYPQAFYPLVNVVIHSDNADDAYRECQRILDGDESYMLAYKFFELYHGSDDARESFNEFYLDVRRGKYTYDGEITEIEKSAKAEFGDA